MKNQDVQVLQEIKYYVDQNIEENILVKNLCLKYAINRNKLQSGFKSLFGQTIHCYILDQKMKKASERLRITPDPIKAIALSIGYSPSNFITKFKRHYGCSPYQFRQRENLCNGIRL
jgi:AraC-like DNA-binding protein